MNLGQFKKAARSLSREQLGRLDEWLHELINNTEASETKAAPASRKIFEEQTLENKTYRLEAVRCGKEKCKCARGRMHGPYWYSYARVDGKLKSEYVGKTLPRKVARNLKKVKD